MIGFLLTISLSGLVVVVLWLSILTAQHERALREIRGERRKGTDRRQGERIHPDPEPPQTVGADFGVTSIWLAIWRWFRD